MLKTSKILGIIGGGLALLLSSVFLLIGIITFFTQTPDEILEGYNSYEEFIEDYPLQRQEGLATSKAFSPLFLHAGIYALIGGVIGIVGGAIVNKNRIIAGILMLIGSGFCLYSVVGFVSFILLLIGNILAFVKSNDITVADDCAKQAS